MAAALDLARRAIWVMILLALCSPVLTRDKFFCNRLINEAKNESCMADMADHQGVLETVGVGNISDSSKKNDTIVLSCILISDLVVVLVSVTIGGITFSCLGQPVIVGYLLAGSLIGPRGLRFISETDEVEAVAQFGVVFLFFVRGLEFSLAKLKAVDSVAIRGCQLQIIIFMLLCGLSVMLSGGIFYVGIFVGLFLSMSSTTSVSKFLEEKNMTSLHHGQVIIDTLILQDCAAGLLFVLLPELGGNNGFFHVITSITYLLMVLSFSLAVVVILSWFFVPRCLKLMIWMPSLAKELYQLALVAFCLLLAWVGHYLGLSLELGSFVAGVMISTTDLAQHTLHQVEAIRNLFVALFLASVGMFIPVQFLWHNVDIMLASAILVIITKTVVVTVVFAALGYDIRKAFFVGLSLAQIGEFTFVLLSRASNLHLIEGKLYFLLLGTTTLSLITTPIMFKLNSCCLHFDILMPSEHKSNMQNEGEMYFLLLGTIALTLSMVRTPLMFKLFLVVCILAYSYAQNIENSMQNEQQRGGPASIIDPPPPIAGDQPSTSLAQDQYRVMAIEVELAHLKDIMEHNTQMLEHHSQMLEHQRHATDNLQTLMAQLVAHFNAEGMNKE